MSSSASFNDLISVFYLTGGPVLAGLESEVGAGGGEEQSSDRGSADIGDWAPRTPEVPV